ncbi:type VI secretion system tip protein VgrG [Dyadobacter sandarakinus]|uniref:Type VI secretion system tip protein VgrG n=1 Tax=Dyadobacter sandarakinus TaxID=2747268 RepID=A0ABX7I4A6_9BACT|nr:type VI secretion system tip protein VgrG [Dyadobacter sandarakinus]QRR00610.1 type VI secretion system tip protein VgrG [Dyadobacter sandarakinus]
MTGLPSNPISGNATDAPTHNVAVTLRMDGKDATQNPGGLMALSVYREVNRIPYARLHLSDGKVEKGTFPKSGSTVFVPGRTAEILLGYQNKVESVFKGIVVRHGVSALHGRASMLELVCHDPAVKMTLVRRSCYFYDKTDQQIFKEVIGTYADQGITAGKLDPTAYVHPEMVQYHCTDWDFLVMRAEANGLVVICEDGKISIISPQPASKADFTATWGDDIIDFEAEMDVRTHFPDVETGSWNAAEQKLVSEKGGSNPGSPGSATAGIGNALSAAASVAGIDLGIEDATHQFPDVLYKKQTPAFFHGGDRSTQELSAWAAAGKKRGELSQVRGKVKVRGRYFTLMKTIEIKRVAGRFNGKHLVTGLLHQVFEGTWQTDVQFGLSTQTLAQSAPEIALPEAAGLLPPIQGLHIGVVTAVSGDKLPGDHRVRVMVPVISGQPSHAQGVWARVAAVTAGEKRGFNFRPEKDDEVILGFINNDPNDAIVLGSLYSKKHPAPVPASEKNAQKGIYTKGKMQLVFDDEEKSILLKTDQGYSILLSEKDGMIEIRDKNKNAVKLSSAGIDLSSTSGISIKATGNVSIQGKQVRINDP